MRCFTAAAAVLVVFMACSCPAMASLPYYNSDLGYTIWLPSGWSEAPDALLLRLDGLRDGVSAHCDRWTAGYTLEGAPRTCLLVSTIHGRVVSREEIANFNYFVVRALKPQARDGCLRLRKASFDGKKNMLRLEMDCVDKAEDHMVAVVHIIYTSTGMLKFTGLTEPGDEQGLKAIDKMVSTLYLDYGLRQ